MGIGILDDFEVTEIDTRIMDEFFKLGEIEYNLMTPKIKPIIDHIRDYYNDNP